MKLPATLETLLEVTSTLGMIEELDKMVAQSNNKCPETDGCVKKEWSSPDGSFRVVMKTDKIKPKKDLVEEMHERPLFVIASNKYKSLADVKYQLREWFEDGTLDSLAAVYKVNANGEQFYIISSTEFDTLEEALTQLGLWQLNGTLDRKSKVYQTKLKNTYEIDVTLVPASV